MTEVYPYNIATQFTSNPNPPGTIDEVQISFQVFDSSISSATLDGTSNDGTTFSFTFSNTLSGPDLTTLNSIVANYVYVAYASTPTIIFIDAKDPGVDGGDFTGGLVWQDRALNAISDIVPFGDLGNGTTTFYLRPGEYDVRSEAPARGVGSHKCLLYDITNDVEIECGEVAYSSADTSYSVLVYHLVVASSPSRTFYKIQHRCQTTVLGTGLGASEAGNTDQPEFYTRVTVTQTAGSKLKEMSRAHRAVRAATAAKLQVQPAKNKPNWRRINREPFPLKGKAMKAGAVSSASSASAAPSLYPTIGAEEEKSHK